MKMSPKASNGRILQFNNLMLRRLGVFIQTLEYLVYFKYLFEELRYLLYLLSRSLFSELQDGW